MDHMKQLEASPDLFKDENPDERKTKLEEKKERYRIAKHMWKKNRYYSTVKAKE